jgi:hypothetical protein
MPALVREGRLEEAKRRIDAAVAEATEGSRLRR